MKMKIKKYSFPLKAPFAITGYTFTDCDTVRVTLEDDGFVGRGEAIGVYFKGENADNMANQLENIVEKLSPGMRPEDVQTLLPSGGARNALDCAMWDIEAKRKGGDIWNLLNITPKNLYSVATIYIDTPKAMAKAAQKYAKYSNLKIKLSSDDPISRLRAIREVRPDAKIIIDVNQGWSFNELLKYLPETKELGIAMIEQPLPRGGDEELEGFKSPVLLGADESCLDVSEYETAAKRYDVINIKLDKCGGLTEGLKIIDLAQRDNKGLMIGNMSGSSLSMAPGYVIGQFCQFVDIDGPLFITEDVENPLIYGDGGIVSFPEPELWG